MSPLQRPAATSMVHCSYEESLNNEHGGSPSFLPHSTIAVPIVTHHHKRSLEPDQCSSNASKRQKFHNPTVPAKKGSSALEIVS